MGVIAFRRARSVGTVGGHGPRARSEPAREAPENGRAAEVTIRTRKGRRRILTRPHRGCQRPAPAGGTARRQGAGPPVRRPRKPCCMLPRTRTPLPAAHRRPSVPGQVTPAGNRPGVRDDAHGGLTLRGEAPPGIPLRETAREGRGGGPPAARSRHGRTAEGIEGEWLSEHGVCPRSTGAFARGGSSGRRSSDGYECC